MSAWSHRIHAIKVTARRELFSTLYGLGLYVVLFVIFLLTAYGSIRVSLLNVVNNGLEALPNPITAPFYLTVFLAATYLGLCSALAISREREQGTLEVLFYGPVDSLSYVLGKFLQQVLTFFVVLGFSLINFFLLSQFTNLGFSGNFFGLFVLSVFLASCMISFGIFLSAAAKRTIFAVILFISLVLSFVIFWGAHSLIMSLPGKNLTTLLIYTRLVLDNVNVLVQWISPLAYFVRGMVAVSQGNIGQYLVSVVSSLIYTTVLLGAAVTIFDRRGVKR
ncbi:MAG: ABC transporter permease subunit [Firmicutes bacterium]|jgi:ABC-type transport system involved in multi-copper enzyme maturation permease subunit|nr:ABC transporter permease subunit [Bacillota bacterium]